MGQPYSENGIALFGATRRVRELLPGDGGCIHESTLRNGEYRHAILVVAGRSRVLLAAACFGSSAVGARARGCGCGDRDRAGSGRKLEGTRFEFIQRALVLEEYHRAVGFAAGLESDSDLTH